MLSGRIKFIEYYLNDFKGLKTKCWYGIIFGFIESILISIYYFFSIYFIDVLHINISTTGIIISLYGFGNIVGGLIGGKLSDKFSPQQVLIVSIFTQAGLFLLLVILKSPLSLGINLFLLGVAAYSFITSNYLIVLDYCDTESLRLRALNILNIGSNLGIGIAAITVSYISKSFDFLWVFYFSSIVFFLLGIFLYIKNVQYRKAFKVYQSIKNDINANGVNGKDNLFLIFSCLFLTGIVVSQLGTTYSIYLKDKFPELGIYAFSILFAINVALIIIFQNFIVNKVKHYNKMLVIGISSFLIGSGMLMLSFSFIFIIAILACIIYTLGEMVFFSIVQLVCYQNSPNNQQGNGVGTYRMVYAASRFFGPMLGGYVYYYLGSEFIWYFSGFIGLFSYILCNINKNYL